MKITTTSPFRLAFVSPVILLALAGGMGGCDSPFGSRDSDRGPMIDPAKLRAVRSLHPESFKRDFIAPPTPGQLAAAEILTGDPTEYSAAKLPPKAPSRFDGMTIVELSIETVRAETLRNNLELQVALIDPSIASQTLRAERAKFEAVFTPFARYRDEDRPTLQTTVPNQQKVLAIGGGVDVPLRTGGRASVDFTNAKTDSPSSVFAGSQLYNSDLTFSISQPLLRNAGDGVSTASIQIAGFNEQIAQARTKLIVISQLARAERQYWLLFATKKELEVRQKQYELAIDQLKQAENRLKAGDVADIEVTRAQSGVAQRLEAIIIAESNALQVERDLKRVMNMRDLDIDSDQAVMPTTLPAPVRFELDTRKLTASAIAERMELVQAELEILADAVNEGVARNQTLPLINLDGSYSFASLGQKFRENYQELKDNRFESFSVGLTGEIPLGNEAAEARLNRSVLVRLQRISSKNSQEQSIRQDVLDVADRLRTGWQRILASRQASVLAGRTLEGERRQFAQGLRTSTDVLDAAARLADSQSAEIRALADYQIAQVDLAVATGTVLGESGVIWEPAPPDAGKILEPVYLPGSPPPPPASPNPDPHATPW